MMADIAELNLPKQPGLREFLGALVVARPSVGIAFVVVLVFVVVATFAPWIAPMDPLAQSFLAINAHPSSDHLLGTDQFGRDLLSRLIYGARTSMILGFLSPLCAAIIGGALGVMAGYFVVDRMISRVIDMLMAFPELLLAILISAALGGGFWNVVFVLTIAFTPGFARVARASTLAVKQEPYVESAIASGVSTPVILIRHIVPNIAAPIVVLLTLWTASAIRLEATLSFLGIGTPPPAPSWGSVIREGLSNMFATSWPILTGGIAITVIVLAVSVIGDAVRDQLDPEAK
jgi:peptide/nickel transport system permease protein